MSIPELNIRKERIEKLLAELKYEITRGIMEREIDESLGFEFIVARSHSIPNGIVFCQFHTRPMLHPPYVGPERGLYVVK